MEASSAQNKSTAQIIDLTYLNDLADGNFDFVEEMINLFLNSVPQSATDLNAAIDAGDWDKVKAIAHRIKPSFGFIGAKDAQDWLGQMEKNAIEAPDRSFQNKLFQQVNQTLAQCVQELQQELVRNKAS
ncbi:MAG: Hpt domain-containing protein [Sphingobacteriales bacterium]|nr:MAG: Hpt domain-containing protein [Sphingobacteriales bacterium]